MVFPTASLSFTSFGRTEETFIFGWIADGIELFHFQILRCRVSKLALPGTQYVTKASDARAMTELSTGSNLWST